VRKLRKKRIACRQNGSDQGNPKLPILSPVLFARMTALRHLHFTQSLEPLYGGGLGASALALHRQILKMGVESTLCSTHGDMSQTSAERTHEFKRAKPGFMYFAPGLKRNGEQLVSSADVIHGHGLYVGTNYIFGVEARRQKKPLAYHVHGMFEPYILRRSRWKKQLVHWLFEDANFRRVRLWRALTLREADQIRGCGISAPIVVAPKCIDTVEYPKPERAPLSIRTPLLAQLVKRHPRVLFLSRIHPKKGLDLLLPAWAKASVRHKDWELVIAGPDENGYLATVRSIAHKLNVHERVAFTGPVTGKEKRELLYSADLFALPSYSEGLPVGLLEAMACELPVLATKECNLPDIGATGAGWLCETNVESIYASLDIALASTDSERKQRGANGKQLVQNRYSWPSIATEILRACEAHCC